MGKERMCNKITHNSFGERFSAVKWVSDGLTTQVEMRRKSLSRGVHQHSTWAQQRRWKAKEKKKSCIQAHTNSHLAFKMKGSSCSTI